MAINVANHVKSEISHFIQANPKWFILETGFLNLLILQEEVMEDGTDDGVQNRIKSCMNKCDYSCAGRVGFECAGRIVSA